MMEIRTFIAIAVDPVILARLHAVQQVLRGADAAVTWVKPDGIHLTLKFLGNVPETRVAEIGDALAAAVHETASFDLTVRGVGGFPNARRPRVIWAGVRDAGDALAPLAAAVETAMAAVGFPRETRPFTPHLTLGRVKTPAGLDRLAPLLQAHAEDEFGEIAATEVALIRSDLLPQGAHYTPLRVMALNPR